MPLEMSDSPFCEEIFPDIQSKSLTWFKAISSHHMACYLREETDSPSHYNLFSGGWEW